MHPLAIDGGTPVRSAPWTTWPIWDQTEEKLLLEVLHSGQWWSVEGAQVGLFEAEMARMQGARHCCAVTNGSHALEIALRAAGVGCGDDVLVPAYTFMATASSVLAVGARPVFVDIEPHSLNMDPNSAAAAVTSRTKAVIPVHVGGCPADLDGVLVIAERHGLMVVEDAAQAHLAEWKGRPVGAIGHVGTFSFQASKNLNSGEGGALVTDDDRLADDIWSIHNVGRRRGGRWYEHAVLGSNYRMTEFQAAILRAQMTRMEDQAQRRDANARKLCELLARIPGVGVLPIDPRVTRHAWHLFSFWFEPREFGGRDLRALLAALNAEGIPCDQSYPPLYKEALFSGGAPGCCGRCDFRYADVHCPVSEDAHQRIVRMHQPTLLGTQADMEDIATAVDKIRRAWNG